MKIKNFKSTPGGNYVRRIFYLKRPVPFYDGIMIILIIAGDRK